MRLPIDLLFVPTWLALVRADGSSTLSATVKASGPYLRRRRDGLIAMVAGQAAACGTIVPKADQLEAQARVEGARRARKERVREERPGMADGRLGRDWMRRQDARAERRAAREARRIMAERRESAMAAFACSSPTWCDGTTNDCHHCPYGREE